MASRERVLELSRKLDKAKVKSDPSKTISILQALQDQPMDIKLLKESGLGKKVNQIRKAESCKSNSQLKAMADALVAKWKQIVTIESNAKKSVKNGKRLKLKTSSSSNGHDSSKQIDHDAADSSCNLKENAEDGGITMKEKESQEEEIGYKREAFAWRTGHDRRDKMISKFIDVLRPKPDQEDYVCFMQLSASIEQAMAEQFGGAGSDLYVQKYRDIHFNLKRNQDLRIELWTGRLTVNKLMTMSSEQMASKSLKKKRDEDKKWAMEEARSDHALDVSQAMTDEYKCGKCKQRKCKYSQAQTRSADEPMTTFITCLVCGNRWKN